MATRYEVRTVVEDRGTEDESLAELLSRGLRGAVVDTAELRSVNNPGRLLVRQWFDAADASEAQLAGLDSIRRVLRDAGLPETLAGAPDVRAGS